MIYHTARRAKGDAWLNSLKQDKEEIIDTLRKKVKDEKAFQTVYDAPMAELKSDEEENEEEKGNSNNSAEEPQEGEKGAFDAEGIVKKIVLLMPYGTSCNKYLKELKKKKE